MPTFLDEVISDWYTKCAVSKDQYAFGQIFWAAAYHPHQLLEVWRPQTLNARLGIASDFQIRSGSPDLFRKSAPYNSPVLKSDEEFVAIRAKKRPVALIAPPDSQLAEIKKSGFQAKIDRHLAVVALIYSVVDAAGNAKFPPAFTDGVRTLSFPQFLFLPNGGPIERDSLLRLDCLQSIATAQLEATGHSLSAEIVALLGAQVAFHLTGLAGDDYIGWRELLAK
jgi:hypothetical protein